MPDLQGQPPGIGPDTAVEGLTPPGDYLLGADDPDVTASGQAVPETLEERLLREQPEALPDDAGAGGRLVDGVPDPDGAEVGAWEQDDAAGLSAEEQAVHVVDE